MINKKAQVFNLIAFIVIAITVVLVFGGLIIGFGLVIDETSKMGFLIGDEGGEYSNFSEINDATFVKYLDGLRVLRLIGFVIIFGMILTIFATNYFIESHPIFMIVHWIVTIVAVVASAIVSNVYEATMRTSFFAAELTQWTGTNFMMLSLPYVVAVIGLIGGVLLFIPFIRGRNIGGGVSV